MGHYGTNSADIRYINNVHCQFWTPSYANSVPIILKTQSFGLFQKIEKRAEMFHLMNAQCRVLGIMYIV